MKNIELHEGTRKAEVIQVIKTVACVGAGVEGDPVREMTQYWTLDGKEIVSEDSWVDKQINYRPECDSNLKPEKNDISEVFLPIHFPYYGASCLNVKMSIDNSPLGGWVILHNDYGEKMFEGSTENAIRFIVDLMEKKHIE